MSADALTTTLTIRKFGRRHGVTAAGELDSSNRERVLELLRAEADRGAAVIIATHDPSVAAGADGHATMDEGRLSWQRRL